MSRYEDILHKSRPVSATHPPMSMHDRAAQFSPFAALTGHDEAIKETARLTDQKVEIEEDRRNLLDQKLSEIMMRIEMRPFVTITVFCPDEKKDGGSYESISGNLLRIKEVERSLVFTDKREVKIDDIFEIEMI